MASKVKGRDEEDLKGERKHLGAQIAIERR